ncbi:U3 small nucleolar RNA-associated protein 14 [[Candida] jaroonii]|uniref:U3 small nucleolar RNA-associated protein 14 n=1 Tax=[Candida] jaroonii TaxID=467808 RepID=A0ACA9YC75_9ASCO|nr:U3 small nucleolar RNA-associated protein 14 [[Candida] jaroonii]
MAKKGGKSKSKRSNQKILNAFEIAERQENASNSEDENSGNESDNFQDGVMDARKFLNQKSGDFEDEEIDSDEALGSDDDYDVMNSKFSQTLRDKAKKLKTKNKQRSKGEEVSSDSEDEAYDSIDEGELVGLSEAWDMDDADLKKFESQGSKNKDIVLDDNWESESSQDEEEDDDEDDEDDEEEESEEESENESDIFDASDDEDVDLSNTVSQLKSKLKKPRKETKKLISESIEESEFNIPTTNKLSISDMMAAVDGATSKDAILIEEEAKALDAPLPRNIQKRHERKAAYEITKEEVSKWEDVVQQNRQAEVLKFPLNPTVKHNDSAITFKSDNVPINDMEKQVHDLLEKSALIDEKKEATFEELAMAKLSPEDLKKRTNELRLMRELMFRDEARARRIKKIKSKTFRKIKKKERLREQALVEGSDDSDKEDHDRKRAEERMNLKHKTQSKWAKSMIKSGLTKDASNRQELEEMLRQGERLRSKQLGYEDGEQSDDDISDIKQEYKDDEDQSEIKSKLGKGVLAMDFMKNAEERKKTENLQELENLRKMEMGEDIEFEDANAVNKVINQGRRIYTPAAANIKDDVNEMNEEIRKEIEEDQSRNLVNQLSKKSIKVVANKESKEPKESKESKEPEPKESVEVEANPWLSTGEVKKSSKAKIIDKDSSREAKAAAKIKNRTKKTQISDEFIDMDENLDIDVNDDDNDEFKQQDLIKEAFAGDNVVSEFKKEKRKVIKDEDDQEEDLTLPGWGDWAGGNKKSKKRKIVRTINGVAQKDKRQDKNMKNVIINERVNKKNSKYQSSEVPYGFESKEQYERSLRMPVGQEWTSRETHQKLTMPRIITKQGSVIDPLKAPFK